MSVNEIIKRYTSKDPDQLTEEQKAELLAEIYEEPTNKKGGY